MSNNSSVRQTELAQYVLAGIYFLSWELPVGSYLAYILLYSFVFGLYMEGLRVVQLPNLIGFTASILLYIFGYENASSFALKFGLGVSICLRYLFGNCDFSNYPEAPEAPFKSGFQLIKTSKYANEVHVYYPIDKDADISNEKDQRWLVHGEKSLKGLLMLSTGKPIPDNEMGPQKMLKHLKGLKIGV